VLIAARKTSINDKTLPSTGASKAVAGVYAAQVLPFFDEKAARAFAGFETAVYQAL
jgi:hypothetical protein